MQQCAYEYVEGVKGVLVEAGACLNQYVAYKQELVQLGQAVFIVRRLINRYNKNKTYILYKTLLLVK